MAWWNVLLYATHSSLPTKCNYYYHYILLVILLHLLLLLCFFLFFFHKCKMFFFQPLCLLKKLLIVVSVSPRLLALCCSFGSCQSESVFSPQKLTNVRIMKENMRTGNLPANMKKNRVLQIIPCKDFSDTPNTFIIHHIQETSKYPNAGDFIQAVHRYMANQTMSVWSMAFK